MSVLRPIHHVFAPLADARQRRRACTLLLMPWRWRRGPEYKELRSALTHDLQGDAFLFSSGREGLLALLRSLKIGNGDQVIVQAYTCVVVPNAITATGATAVYVDIERDTLNLDPQELAKAITPKTKAVICQHTFGIPAPLSELKALCAKHGIPLIEDCAHILPDAKGPRGIAMTGEYALLSFGRDKAVSGVGGGAVISRVSDTSMGLQAEETKAIPLSLFTIKRLLLYPLLYGIGRPLYGLGIGKIFLALCGKLGLLIPIVTSNEKHGQQSPVLHHLPNACAALVVDQWMRRQEINDHRRRLTEFYLRTARAQHLPIVPGACEGLPLQKFPLFVPGAEKLRQELKKQNIHLHDGWTGCVVCPGNVDPAATGYSDGSDPRAEDACEQILSLPTHLGTSLSDAKRLISSLL